MSPLPQSLPGPRSTLPGSIRPAAVILAHRELGPSIFRAEGPSGSLSGKSPVPRPVDTGRLLPADDIRVAIIAADPLVGTGLASLLSSSPDVEVVAQVGLLEELGPTLDGGEADLLLWDLSNNSDAELEMLREAADSGLAIVALLSEEDSAANAWVAGARGLLLRQPDRERLLGALRSVARGLVTLDPDLATTLLPSPSPPGRLLAEPLTPRELEVLELVAGGLTNKAIANRLGISEHTVKFHLNAILGKLGAQSRTEAVVRATRLGLIVL